mmetsp:Transcript_33986/g.108035  ORF Transcript_33986/g.108035 Transcript_33986/m.108035 type:complete len:346 (-) Transcript_33986:36-1073(-)
MEAAREELLQRAQMRLAAAAPHCLRELACGASETHEVHSNAGEARVQKRPDLLDGHSAVVPAEVIKVRPDAGTHRVAPEIEVAVAQRGRRVKDDFALFATVDVQPQHTTHSAGHCDMSPPAQGQQALAVEDAIAHVCPQRHAHLQPPLVGPEQQRRHQLLCALALLEDRAPAAHGVLQEVKPEGDAERLRLQGRAGARPPVAPAVEGRASPAPQNAWAHGYRRQRLVRAQEVVPIAAVVHRQALVEAVPDHEVHGHAGGAHDETAANALQADGPRDLETVLQGPDRRAALRGQGHLRLRLLRRPCSQRKPHQGRQLHSRASSRGRRCHAPHSGAITSRAQSWSCP